MKQSRKPNETVLAILVCIVVATIALCAAWAGIQVGRAQVMRVSDARLVYLTFDDGPTAGYTREVLADLNAAGAHATFFEVGVNMRGNEALMRQMVADGEQLGTHSWDHPKFVGLSPVRTAWEIAAARALQVRITGLDSRLFRYPYDQPSDAGAVYLGQQGMLAIDAGINVEDWDWRHVSDQQVISRIMAQVFPGAIIQLHDGMNAVGRDHGNPGYLPGLLRALKQQGYAMVTLPGQAVPNNGAE